ncbi:hypothetical protein CHELA1G2_21449 [Hyphomicrobiales bacterium]|nr:hypothetical protein CHELA1G2_21449 [Hyphomicrobiales bacterium]
MPRGIRAQTRPENGSLVSNHSLELGGQSRPPICSEYVCMRDILFYLTLKFKIERKISKRQGKAAAVRPIKASHIAIFR